MKLLLAKTLIENLEVSFRDLSQFDTKLFEPKTRADFETNKILETATAKNARFYWTRNFAKNQNPNLEDSKCQFETQLIFEKATQRFNEAPA